MLMFVVLAAFSPWVPAKNTLPPKTIDTDTITTTEDPNIQEKGTERVELILIIYLFIYFVVLSATITSEAALDEQEKLDEGLLGPGPKKSTADTLRAQWAAFSLLKVLKLLGRNWRTIAFMISLMVMAWINVLGNFLFVSF
jgi:hypothetical protein